MELELVRWLRSQASPHAQLLLGIGDDAALLNFTPGRSCVVTSDLLAEGTHFKLAEVEPRRVGRKALAVNLSDIAAMAAKPVAAIVSLLLPKQGGAELARELYAGLLPLAKHYDVALAGGDTNSWDGGLVINVTLLGETTERGPLVRSGAKPGDAIVVTGEFGGSLAGKHFDFEPRVHEALLLNDRYELHAGMDVTDGIALDLWRLCQESGCGAVVSADQIPISAAAHEVSARAGDNETALDHALSDGEDFELLLAAPTEVADAMLRDKPLGIALTRIGRFVPEPGLWLETENGQAAPLVPRGFEH